ncbi:unnamed protein product [Brassica napus]|uniref:Diphthine--ammonia ligase n=1 Tax=Brassica napus TaxID=3708 RepID=A0A816U0U2_BRANA|nr:unnamed protein product [Brassica napus]
MKVVALVSGGKDSCYVMMKCIQYGHEIVALANLLPVDDSVDELDSYMYQTVGHQIIRVTRFCVYLLNKTLSENSFSWKDTTSLRIHFSTSLGVSVKRLFNIFETAFKELNEMSPEGINLHSILSKKKKK